MRGEQAHPTRDGLDQVSADREELYRCQPPAILRFPILVQLSAVNDDIPEEAEIEMAVRGLKGGREGVLLGIRAEDLKRWRQEAKRENYSKGRRWGVLVQLVQVMFRDVTVSEEIA